MKPIINPLYIYLISIISTLKTGLAFIMLFAGLAFIVVGMLYFLGEVINKKNWKTNIKNCYNHFYNQSINLDICSIRRYLL